MGIENEKGMLRKLGNLPGAKEAALAAGILAIEPMVENSFGDSSEAHAATIEIGPHENWNGGVSRLFTMARENPNEVQTYYLQADGKNVWSKTITGNAEGVPLLGDAGRKHTTSSDYDEMRGIAKDASETPDVCAPHTHGRGTLMVLQKQLNTPKGRELLGGDITTIDLNGRVSLPPSSRDMARLPKLAAQLQSDVGKRINYVGMTIDPTFLSYYQQFPDEQSRIAFMRSLKAPTSEEAAVWKDTPHAQFQWLKFVNTSELSAEELLKSREYDLLRYTNARYGNQLRLVTEKGAMSEPACAGVRDPSKKVF